MRSILIISLIVIAMLLAYDTYEKNYFSNKKQKSPNQKIENKPINEATFFLIPVTNFKSKLNALTFKELSGSPLLSLTTNGNLLPDSIKENVKLVSEVDLKSDTIFLLTPEQVKPQYKTLYLDGEFFWSKDFNLQNYPLKTTLQSEEPQKLNNITTIFASGEIIPARAVDRLALNKYNDYTYLFDFFRSDIENADLAIAMLENSVMGNPAPCTGCMSFTGDDQVIKGFAETGFDFISTAGNHAGDAGQKAYLNTIKLLEQEKIEYTGTGNCVNNCTEESYDILKPAIREMDGTRIGMLAADDVAAYYWKQNDASDSYGTNSFSKLENGFKLDETKVAKVKAVKTKYEIDYLIVYLSWGVEYTNAATKHQQELGRKLIDSGVDLIIASHPHWVQNIEFYNGKPIIYSLGNFIFDQTHTLETRQGAVVNLHYLDNASNVIELKNIEIMPHQICGYHQTKNDITPKLLAKETTLAEIKNTEEKNGCVYWQPKKLDVNDNEYMQILDRIYEFTSI